MKYRPVYPNSGLKDLTGARKWVEKPVCWYDHQYIHSGIKLVTSYQRHYRFNIKIMKRITEIYQKAKAEHPERWSGDIRDCSLPEYVTLSPIDTAEVEKHLNKQNYLMGF